MSYQPTVALVKTHPLPDWYNDAKFGIFIHWGLYSLPAYAPLKKKNTGDILGGSWSQSPYAEWYQNSLRITGSPVQQYHAKTYGTAFCYEQFAALFNEKIQKWDPSAWAGLFARVGARYVVLVSKHHDGFLMWNSRHTNPRLPGWQVSRDVAGDLSRAVSSLGLKMGFYYSSLLDWSFTQKPITSLVELVASSPTSRQYIDYVEKHWLELIERYDPWILWSDIGCPPGYNLPKLWAHFYNTKPEGVINDRWVQVPKIFFSRPGRYVLSKILKRLEGRELPRPPHYDFITPEYAALDHIAPYKWETCRGIGNSFGYNQFEDAANYQSADDLIRLLADITSKNGNLLLNVGPNADGSIHPLQVQALEGIGAWLKVNGEAIYGTRPWIRYTDSDPGGAQVRYTAKDGALYIIVTKLPESGLLRLPPEMAQGNVVLLETGEPVEVSADRLSLKLPETVPSNSIPVIKIQPVSEMLVADVKA